MFLDVAAAGCLQSCDVGPFGNLDDVANWPKFRPQIEKGPLKSERGLTNLQTIKKGPIFEGSSLFIVFLYCRFPFEFFEDLAEKSWLELATRKTWWRP
jgi:hypothetical protein